MNILNVQEPLVVDESLTRYEYHSILPYSSVSLGNNDEIRIPIHQQDVLTLPCESRLYIEGTMAVAEGRALGENEGLVDYAMGHLFSEISYEMNGIIVDRCRNPGITGVLKGVVSFSEVDKNNLPNSSGIVEEHNFMDFNFCVPLKMLLGFAEDYKKVLVNVKQELVLLRSRSNNNALLDSTGDKRLTLTLNTIQWQVPFVSVSDSNRLHFLKLLQQNIPIQVGFRTWQLYEYPNLPSNSTSVTWPVRMASATERPRFVIVAFQTNRTDVITRDASKFDRANVRSVRLHVGSESYPYTPLQTNFAKRQFATLYENYSSFRKQYYHEETAASLLTPLEFFDSYPIWVIDCSRQNEVVKTGSVDIRVAIDASENFPAQTTAYCLIFSDSLIEYVPFTGIVRQLT